MESQTPTANAYWRWPLQVRTVVVWIGVLVPLFLMMAGLLLLTWPAAAAGPTPVSGLITMPTTWEVIDSPYIVTDTVTIQNSAVLTVEAGVEVRFDGGTFLNIRDGRLVAEGTPSAPITFTANTGSPGRNFWGGLTFDDTSGPSTLRHCVVEYAGTGVSSGDSDNHEISSCIFRHNGDGSDLSSGGALNSEGDWLTITGNQIYDNELGLRLRKSFYDIITGNSIHNHDGFGIGFIAQGAPGGGNNLLRNNQIHNNGGDGLQLDDGYNNQVLANQITDNDGHGVWARAQSTFQLTGNTLRANGRNGLTYAEPNSAPNALHSNVLCNNLGFEIESFWTTSLLAEGNWFGTNTPASGVEISGTVDFTPWISMGLEADPAVLPADGTSMTTVNLTMAGGGRTVPDGYQVQLTADPGSVSSSTLTLIAGQASTTYTAGTVAGPVEFQVTDQCTSLLFVEELTLEAVDLAVYKAGPGGTAYPGDLITYTLGISELKGIDALNVVITDVLPTGTAWFTDTSASCDLDRTFTPEGVIWTASQWAGGSDCWFDLVVEVEPNACHENKLENSVSVASATTDGDLSNNTWTTGDDSPAVICLNLSVSKADSGLMVGPNKEYSIEYTIVVSNAGPMTATGVVLTDVIPSETSYTGSDWNCAAGVCSQLLGTVLPSTTVQISLPLQLDKSALQCPILFTNTVQVADDTAGSDLNLADNVYTLTTEIDCLPDLVVVVNDNVGEILAADTAWVFEELKVAPEQSDPRPCVYAGEWITYTIGYVNTGLVTATQVVLTETIPEHTSYIGYDWNCLGDTCTRNIGSLQPNEGGVAHFVVRVDTVPPDLRVENEVHIGGAEEDLYPPDNVSYDDTPICEPPPLLVHKDDNLPCAFPGDEIRYTIVFTNPSDVELPGVVLTETLPAYTTYLTSPGWLPLGDGQFIYEYGSLQPYTSASVEFAVQVEDPLPDTVLETVNIVCLGYDGTSWPGNCYNLTTPLPLVSDLRVVKHDHIGPPPPPDTLRQLDRSYQVLYDKPYQHSASSQEWAPVGPGDVFSYTITYLNLGRRPATGVVLTETLPAHTSYVGYGWTHVGGSTYTYHVGDLGVSEGGQRNFWVQADESSCSGDDYLYNWVYISGNEEECNRDNNWSGEETPVEWPPCRYSLYLPLVTKEYPQPPPPPKPTPTPVPDDAFVKDVAVNPETNRVYVASPAQDTVLAIDPTGDGSVIASIPVGDYPLGLAVVTTTNKIYAANFHSWTLTAIRGSDHTRIVDWYVGAQASKVAADSGDARVYVTNHLESDNGAAAINSQTDEFEYYYTRMHATQGRYGIDVDPAADKLFIAARDAGLIAIQDAYLPNQDPQLFKLDPPRVPYVVAFNPATEHLFVTAADDNRVVVLAPYSIQWNKGVWITWRGRRVFVLNRANAGWIKEIGVGSGAEEGIAINPLTGYVYVTNAESDTVSIIKDDYDPAQIKWIKDLTVGDQPQGVDVDVKTDQIYVGNAGSRDLTVIDGATQTVVKTIPLE